MRICANRTQLIWSPLVGWVLLSSVVAQAVVGQSWAQTPAATPDSTTTTTSTSTPTLTPGAGGSAPTGTTYGSILTPPPGTPDKTGTTPDGTNPDGTTPGGQTRVTPPPPAPPPRPSSSALSTAGFAGTPDAQIAPPSFTSSSGVLLYGAPVGGSIPVFGGGGADVNELGISLGSFTLFPTIDITTGLDSNVFAQNASAGTTSSPYMLIVPSLELRSEWLNHQLRVALGGGFGFYSNAPTQNYQNYSLMVDGKLEIREDFYLTPGIGFKRATEALGTPNTSFAQAPTVVDTVPVKIGVYQRFNRFFYDISGTATRYWHYDNSTITASGLPASSRDRWEYAENFKFGYEISDDFSLYVSPVVSQIRYINPINSADQSRDSNNLGLGIGGTWILSPTSSFDGTIGYTSRSYTSGGLGGTTAWTGSLSGSWNGYAPLTLRPTISRSIQETALSDFKNTVLTAVGLDFSYLIHDDWTVTGGVSMSLSDLIPADGTSGVARTDTIFRGQIGFLYSINPRVAVGPFYEYTNGSTTDPTNGPIYDRQQISIRLTARR